MIPVRAYIAAGLIAVVLALAGWRHEDRSESEAGNRDMRRSVTKWATIGLMGSVVSFNWGAGVGAGEYRSNIPIFKSRN